MIMQRLGADFAVRDETHSSPWPGEHRKAGENEPLRRLERLRSVGLA